LAAGRWRACAGWLNKYMSIKPIEAPAGLAMPETPSADAVVLPRETDGEIGLYDDSVVTLVKELREAGASAEFMHGAESRSFIGEKAVDVLVVSLVIGIASNAGWDALRAVLSRRGKKPVEVKAARYEEEADGKRWEWIEAKGEGEAVAAAIDAWRRETGERAADGTEE
jgi:hypothetical protein